MKLVKTASGKMSIKISKQDWMNIGKKQGWIKSSQEEQEIAPDGNYDDVYEIPTPPDHSASSRVIKKYRLGNYAEIEKYDDGYFGVVNVVHGTTVLWTKNWGVAKDKAQEQQTGYKSI